MAISLPSIFKNIAAPKGANASDVQLAQDQMAMQYAPQEAGINTTIQTIQDYLNQDVSAQQQYGQIADQKISEVGGQLAQQLQGNVGAIGNIYQAGTQRVGSIYDQAQQATQAAGSSIRDRLSGAANALGQGQALKADAYGNDPISRLLAQQASTETGLAASKAGSQANLTQLGTALSGIAQKAVGDSEREYAQKRSNLATEVMRNISQLQLGSNRAIMEQLQKYSVLAEVAGPTFRTLLSAATSARTQAERQAAKDQLDAMATMARIQKDKASAAKDIRAEDPNSLDNLLKQATLQGKLNDLSDYDKQPTYVDAATGQHNLMEFLNDLRVNKKALTGRQYAGIQNFINQNSSNASALNQDPYSYLVGEAQRLAGQGSMVQTPRGPGATGNEGHYQVPLQVLLESLGKRYTSVASSGSKIGTKVK